LYQCEWGANAPFIFTNPSDSPIFSRDRLLPFDTHTQHHLLDENNENPIVVTKLGPVKGLPYGEDTGGENRFRNPVPKKPWTGTGLLWDATRPSPLCLQLSPFSPRRAIGTENCLTLDIYTPSIPRNKSGNGLLPVFMLIPGGAFWFGGSRSYGPKYLLREDIIFVPINVRMEVFGWLSTGDEHASGNWALKDMALAVEFVHNNIKPFGGDPNRIIIGGTSSAAVSAHLMLFTNHRSRNYVKGIVGFSGTALTGALDVHGRVRDISDAAAETVGCPTSKGVGGSKIMIQCLRKTPSFVLANLAKLARIQIPPILFIPTLESPSPTAFISEPPEVQYRKGTVPPIPLILTRNEDELQMELLPIRYFLPLVRPLYSYWMPLILHFLYRNTFELVNAAQAQKSLEKVNQFYLGKSTPPNFISRSDFSKFSQIISDAGWLAPMWKSIEYHHKVAPTYTYIMKTKIMAAIPLLSLGRERLTQFGAPHGSELALFYNMTRMFPTLSPGSEFDLVSRRLINMIANFAAHGAPLYRNEEGKLLNLWKPVEDIQNPIALEVGLVKDIKMIVDPIAASGRLKIWEEAKQEIQNDDGFAKAMIKFSQGFCIAPRILTAESGLGRQGRLSDNGNADLVYTKMGPVKGFKMKISDSKEVFAYTGVPYGESTAGENRFRPPVAKKPWQGCGTQPGADRIRGKEDCLTVDIYTPQLPRNGSERRLPVFLFIPGGSFWFGDSRSYGPKYLLREDVIFVAINVRMEVFGWLSTGDEHAPGNWALKDQALSIEFVHNNIKAFGGDPNKIIIGGMSSSAVTAHLMLFTNHRARNYVSGIMCFSGTSLWSSLDVHGSVRRISDSAAESVGCPTSGGVGGEGSKRMVECLRKIPAFLLVQFQRLARYTIPPAVFTPTLEPPGPSAFITEPPEVQYMKGVVPPIPLIVSRAEDELQMELLPMRPSLPLLTPLYFQLMPVAFHLGFRNTFDIVDASVSQASFRKVHQFYFGKSTPPNFLVGPDYSTFTQMMNDAFGNAPMWKSIEYHHKIAPTYAYIQKNNVIAEMPLLAFARGITRRYGAGHGSELGLLFNMSRMTYPLKPGSDFDIASRRLVNLIVNFADHGAPLYRNEEGKLLDVWKPVTDMNNPIALEVGLVKDIKMIVDPYLRLNHQLEMGPTFLVQFLCAWFQCEFGPMPPFIYTNPDNRRLLPPNPLSAPFRSRRSLWRVHSWGKSVPDPVPRRPWKGTWDATYPSPFCVQSSATLGNVIRGQEECLFLVNIFQPVLIHNDDVVLILDIYAPKIPQNGDKNHPLLPVIMWIPAGSSTFGRSRFYGPKYFLREDVILVPINHRVGIIAMSGTALVNQALDAVGQVREMSDLVADSANCPNSTARDGSWRMVQCLQSMDPYMLAARFASASPLAVPPLQFRPVIEPRIPSAFISELPEVQYRKGKVPPIPLVVTRSRDEVMLVVARLRLASNAPVATQIL
ncbi:Esterase E4, partial [Orchesella cincta]